MKLLIQIPCLNERETLAATLADLPRSIPGVDSIEVLIVDDGSSDGTRERAIELGVHHVVRFPKNRGLAAAFMAGIDAGLRLGADVIVNTDADNQYRGADIPALVAPILAGRADLVIGDRQTDRIAHFSPLKKLLQRWGSRFVRALSASDVTDSPSGFRAVSRKAALRLFVHSRFTYTLETVIQAGRVGLAIENVPVATNAKTRESRLFRSIPDYLRRAGGVMVRAYCMYQPVQIFLRATVLLAAVGLATWARFLYLYVVNRGASGQIQSLIIGTGFVVLAVVSAIATMLAELLASNRRLLEEVLVRVRRLDCEASAGTDARTEGLTTTDAPPWRSGDAARLD
ncbi:MAG: glycosyltransferase family 2 protein [Deltaproteobacteria bacterium]|nr:glycosyltransferase family 2 protein [Deltaproteobacteria bacterium]